MIIEVTGCSTGNKGAELMLRAICEHFRVYDQSVEVAVNQFFGSPKERWRYGLFLIPHLGRVGRSSIALQLMPKSFRKAIGIVRPSEVHAVLDASGFAFSDQLPIERIREFAELAERTRESGKSLILLPQALGPFKAVEHRDAFRRVIMSASLIFARDKISFQHAIGVEPLAKHIKLAPDFTNLIQASQTRMRSENKRVAIVPNCRMVEEAISRESSGSYISVMATCIMESQKAGLDPFLLIHGSDDSKLAIQILNTLENTVELLEEPDPVRLKNLLGDCSLVIASRFHALVSALSQGVPCIGTSWSHKYEMLFEDYGCTDMMLKANPTKSDIRDRIDWAMFSRREQLIKNIEKGIQNIVPKVEAMWKEVDENLGISTPVAYETVPRIKLGD